MSVHTQIEDPSTGQKAAVTPRGQLVVSNLSFSRSFTQSIDVANTAFNLVLPEDSQKFIVTDIILTGDKSISTVTDATVVIYETTSLVSLVEDNVLLEVDVARSATLIIDGLNLITEEASKFINIKSTDVNIKATLMGFYVEE